jgi:hypothetical protein
MSGGMCRVKERLACVEARRHESRQGHLAALELLHVCERAQLPWHEGLYVWETETETETETGQRGCHQLHSVRRDEWGHRRRRQRELLACRATRSAHT